MGNKKKESFRFDAASILEYLISNFRFLAVITLAAMILSVIISLSMEEKYRSTVVLFPAASVPVAQSLLAPNFSSGKGGITSFGEEEEAEQVLQILNSDEIRDRIVDKFNLLDHYEIDSTSRYYQTAIRNKFRSNISFRRTEFLSIEISVLDKNPQIASNIANEIAALLDSVMNHIKRERALKAFAVVSKEYHSLMDEMKTMQDSITELRKLGVNHYESQAEVLTDGYTQAIIRGNFAAAKTISAQLETIGKYGSQYVAIRDYLEAAQRQLIELRAKYIQAKVEAENELPNKFIVDTAYPADKKSYPVRWIIVVVSTFSAFIFALIASLVLDNLKKVTRKETQ